MINAINNKDSAAVAKLLDESTAQHGLVADANVKLGDKSTPLHCAVQCGNVNIVEILLKNFAEVNAQDEEGICPLHLACMSGNINMVKKLLSRPELTVDLQDSEGNTPVHKAASTLSDEIMFLLIERNPKVTSVMNTQQKTCIDLYQARGKQAGQQKKVDALLEKIANLS